MRGGQDCQVGCGDFPASKNNFRFSWIKSFICSVCNNAIFLDINAMQTKFKCVACVFDLYH